MCLVRGCAGISAGEPGDGAMDPHCFVGVWVFWGGRAYVDIRVGCERS